MKRPNLSYITQKCDSVLYRLMLIKVTIHLDIVYSQESFELSPARMVVAVNVTSLGRGE